MRNCFIYLLLPLFMACTTTSKPKKSKEPVERPDIKEKADAVPVTEKPAVETASPVVVVDPTTARMLTFVNRHQDPTEMVTTEEEDLIQNIKSPASNSVEETVLAIAMVKSVVRPSGERKSFEESDITTSKTADQPQTSVSLEAACKDRSFNFINALKENRQLQNFSFSRMTISALKKSSNSPEFNTAVLMAIKRNADLWASVGKQLDVLTGTPPQPTDGTAVLPVPTPMEAVQAVDVSKADEVLMHAQELALQGQTDEAIKLLRSIPSASPLHMAAVERIKSLSNASVKILRQKAATSFQGALPASDPKTRIQYLEEAKTYLDQALIKYPEADQLATVRDNLDVISRDLERIKREAKN